MSFLHAFSPNYDVARRRFRAAAAQAGLELTSYPLSIGDDAQSLTIDVAVSGPADAKGAVVVSSGLHGVEAPFGSAVQLALLESGEAERIVRNNRRLVLLHALNPYGFAHRRRVNEDSVDLNRNFLLPDEPYAGAPELYAKIDGWLNPPSSPRRWLPVPLRGAVDLLRRGARDLFAAIPAGQYEFPQGLFFGGRRPAESTRIVQQNMALWLGEAEQIVHLDFHTGLGKHATHKLLLDCTADDPDAAWFAERFGNGHVSALPSRSTRSSKMGSQSYASRGSFGLWCRAHFAQREYHFATAEFGTYHPIRVLLALRAENRAHHWGRQNDDYEWVRRWLTDVFAPASDAWRQRVVRDGLDLVRRAAG